MAGVAHRQWPPTPLDVVETVALADRPAYLAAAVRVLVEESAGHPADPVAPGDAAAVAHALTESFRVPWSPDEVAGSRVEDLATRLAASPLTSHEPLVRVAGPTDGAPVFVVPAGDGEVGWFLGGLARGDALRPVYGLIAPGWWSGVIPRDVDVLVESYVAATAAAGPPRDCTVVGYCIGSGAALELTARLAAEGWRVREVVLVDPSPGAPVAGLDQTVAFRLRQVRKRRHPVMHPFHGVASRTTVDEVKTLVEGPHEAWPDEPVTRTFLAGIVILYRAFAAVEGRTAPVAQGPVRLVLSAGTPLGALAADRPGEVRAGMLRVYPAGVDVTVLGEPHVRAFDDPVLRRLLVSEPQWERS